jgi:hypothetical protein
VTDVRHATTEELLALRDGEGTLWTKSHVADCAACASALWKQEQLRAQLRALPTFTPPRDRWAVVATAARQEHRRSLVRRVTGLATAAALAGLTFVALRPAQVTPLAAQEAALERAMVRSQVLEEQLRVLDRDRHALDAAAARAAAELESRLQQLDARLAEPEAWRSRPGDVADLWAERAGLLSALVDVHVTRVAAAGL